MFDWVVDEGMRTAECSSFLWKIQQLKGARTEIPGVIFRSHYHFCCMYVVCMHTAEGLPGGSLRGLNPSRWPRFSLIPPYIHSQIDTNHQRRRRSGWCWPRPQVGCTHYLAACRQHASKIVQSNEIYLFMCTSRVLVNAAAVVEKSRWSLSREAKRPNQEGKYLSCASSLLLLHALYFTCCTIHHAKKKTPEDYCAASIPKLGGHTHACMYDRYVVRTSSQNGSWSIYAWITMLLVGCRVVPTATTTTTFKFKGVQRVINLYV